MRIRQYLQRISVLCLILTGSLTAQAQAENMDTLFDIHHLLGYLVAAFLITIFVMIFFNRVIYYREQEITKEAERVNAQLGLIMTANQTEAWTYNFDNDIYKFLSKEDLTETIYTPYEFSQFYDREDFAVMRMLMASIRDGEELSGTTIVKSASDKEGEVLPYIYEINISILQRNRKGNPVVLLGTQRDITKEQEQAKKAKNLMLRYHTVFNSSLVDMIYYDANGILSDLNDKACETFGITDRQSLLNRKVRITDIPSYSQYDIRKAVPLYLSSVTDIAKVKKDNERIPEISIYDKIYYEAMVDPIYDKHHKLLGVIAAGRNITDMVESNHHQKQAGILLSKKTKDIQQYIQNINYSLKVSNVRLINYYPKSHELEISNDLSSAQFRLSQIRAVSLIHDEDRLKAVNCINKLDWLKNASFSETLRTVFHDKEGRDVYLNFNVMPILTPNGEVSHYFGMCRNETEMTYTERELQEETKKAQEEEQLKNTFLLNMSYELRTPLNAVVGFAGLYNIEHNEEDEAVFAEEIKKNTNVLLTLINDILFLSRLDARMIEYNYQECDFALLFDGWCYMGWSNLTPDVKVIIENPYNSLSVKIDQQNLGIVIQKLCIYSGFNTKQGTVRAKYEYRRGELMITIEDTSKGMDEATLSNAFNRFSHEEGHEQEGTGLDLPIVKELIEQMNGTIELQSELGKGNTFFVNIPCEMSSFDKKAGILN